MRLLFQILLVTIAYPAFAQFTDSTNYFVRYASTGIVNRTNDNNSYVLNNQLRFSVYRKNISLNTNNAWIFGKQNGSVTNNDFMSTLDFDLYKTKKHLYYWGLVNYEKSLSLKITNRLQTGLGVGLYLIDRDDFVIQLSDGILYETSELSAQEGIAASDYETFRNSFRLKFRFVFKDAITLDGVDFLLHSVSDRKDYILRSTTNLSVKLLKWISLTTSVTYNKIRKTGRENFLLNYGLTIEKYF